MFDIPTVAAAALGRSEAVVSHWLPEGKRQGAEWVALNPTRGDAHRGSFSVNLATGAWGDFATGDKGGDLVSLVAYLGGGKSQGEAARTLGEFLGLSSAERDAGEPPKAARGSTRPAASAPRPIMPIPADAESTRPQTHPTLGEPSAIWTYRDAEGRPCGYVLRFETKTRSGKPDKTFRPLVYWPERKSAKGEALPAGWDWRNIPAPRPLYRLDALALRPEAPALICEGEKAADAAADLLPDMVATCTMNGAQSPQQTDFGPLHGRRVLIWPDADAPGARYAETVARLAHEAGAASVAVLDLATLAGGPPHV